MGEHQKTRTLSGGIEVISEQAYQEVKRQLDEYQLDEYPHRRVIESDAVYGLLAYALTTSTVASGGLKITDEPSSGYEDLLRTEVFRSDCERGIGEFLDRLGLPVDSRNFKRQVTEYLFANVKPEELRQIIPQDRLEGKKYFVSGGLKFKRPGLKDEITHNNVILTIKPQSYSGKIGTSGFSQV